MQTIERFIRKTLPAGNGCLEWVGSRNSDGYGNFWIGSKCEKAHRAAWILKAGSIPDNLQVLHSCDNPSCVNTEHLRLGTIRDNMADKMRRGRHHTAKRQTCSRGHFYEKTGVQFFRQRHGGIGRVCKECHKQRGKEAYARRKAIN